MEYPLQQGNDKFYQKKSYANKAFTFNKTERFYIIIAVVEWIVYWVIRLQFVVKNLAQTFRIISKY